MVKGETMYLCQLILEILNLSLLFGVSLKRSISGKDQWFRRFKLMQTCLVC